MDKFSKNTWGISLKSKYGETITKMIFRIFYPHQNEIKVESNHGKEHQISFFFKT